MKFIFSKKVLVIMFFMKKYFSAENVFIFQIFLRVTLFFISIMFLFVCLFVCFEERGGREVGGGRSTSKAYQSVQGVRGV